MSSPQYPNVTGPWSGMMDDYAQKKALTAGAGMFRTVGPEGAAFADVIERDPWAAAEMARQFGGFEALHQQLVASNMAAAQMANAGVGRDYTNVLAGLPTQITTPEEYARAQNVLALGGVPPAQWSAILSNRMPADPNKVQVGSENQYRDRWGNKIEGLGGPMAAGLTVNVGGEPRKFSDYNSLRKAYAEEQLPYVEITRALNKARALSLLDSPEADIDLITAIAKAVDPGSVVREGEITMRINNAPLRRVIQRYFKKAVGSGGFLTADDRLEIVEALEAIAQAEEQRARNVESAYRGVLEGDGGSERLEPFVIPESVETMRQRAFEAEEGGSTAVPRARKTEKIGGATVEWLDE